MTITVYGRETCMPCRATKNHLDKWGLDYTALDVDDNPDARETVETSGRNELPMVVVADDAGTEIERWHGYRPERIRRLTK